uniref:transposase n=1 Tax=Vibrio jasicida TaxID=766224 RepID=UPI0028059290|nr:transposase [Vibrio jasicida]
MRQPSVLGLIFNESMRPPISGSRLYQYSKGGQLTLEYLNHRTGEKEMLTLAAENLIYRLMLGVNVKGSLHFETHPSPSQSKYNRA